VSRLRKLIADPHTPDSLSAKARGRRWASFAERFPDLAEMRVLDLGGEMRSWAPAPVRPKQLMIVNLTPQQPDGESVRTVVGDACELAGSLRDERFDLVFSNSVIEHVGGHDRCTAFAHTVHEKADHHWVQTPYRYFPIEPHWVFPGFQFLPLRARAEVTRRWRMGRHTNDLAEAIDASLTVELLSVTAMRHYFPESEIRHERLFGLTKALLAGR